MVSQSVGRETVKIDTQGMADEVNSEFTKSVRSEFKMTPFEVKQCKCFTDVERDELKQIIREVLLEFV